jgi:hypothetical protein
MNSKVFVVVRDEESESSLEILGIFSSRVDAQEYVYGVIRDDFMIDDLPDDELFDEIAGSGINYTIESHYLR